MNKKVKILLSRGWLVVLAIIIFFHYPDVKSAQEGMTGNHFDFDVFVIFLYALLGRIGTLLFFTGISIIAIWKGFKELEKKKTNN